MSNPLASGLNPEKDFVFPRQPEHPEMRESVSIWLFEENGAFAFPRIGIEAEAWSWEDRLYHANFAFADGRVLNATGCGEVPSAIDAQDNPTIFGAGPLTFQCIDPFKQWTMIFDGEATDGRIENQIDASFKTLQTKTRVRAEVDMTMVTPAWVQEVSDNTDTMSTQEADNAKAMGMGYRYEHLFRARGTLTIDDRQQHFNATGVRIHRQSVRNLAGFFGHCWLSAVFPDGRAFACLAYPPREGETAYSYNDAVIFQNGRLVTATILDAPFLTRIISRGDDVSVTLESELGKVCIKGETLLNTFRVNNPDIGGMNLQQGGALFTWDDQQAYGMVERSRHESLTHFG